METIKGGFPLPTNRLVRNCNSSGKLSKLESMPVCCWEGALLQAAALLPRLLGLANPFSPQHFPMLSLVIELWIPNLTTVVWSPHRPASAPYSPAVSTPDPEYPLGISTGSWQLCTPSSKLKIFFSRNMLSETKQNSLLDVGCFFLLSPFFPWFSFFPVLHTSWLVLLLSLDRFISPHCLFAKDG